MSRARFLSQLRQHLEGLPQAEIDEIAADYEFHFSEAAAAGQAEEETAASLGDPARIARELRNDPMRKSAAAPRPGILLLTVRYRALAILLPAVLAVGIGLLAYRFLTGPGTMEASSITASPNGIYHVARGQKLELGKIRRERLHVILEGGSQANGEGRVGELVLEIRGGGRAEFGGLEAAKMRVVLTGGGEALLRGGETADIAITGSGIVRFTQRPRRFQQKINGSGGIEFPP